MTAWQFQTVRYAPFRCPLCVQTARSLGGFVDCNYAGRRMPAVLALAVPGLLQWLSGWPGMRGLLVANVLLFVGLCLLLRSPRLAGWLIPQALRRWRASRLARQQFREQNLQRTAGGTGVLIFVSEAEQHVEILVDRGVSQHLDAAARAAIVARFAEHVRQGHTLQGFVECIEACGELLSEHLPSTHARNELPNRLVVLD